MADRLRGAPGPGGWDHDRGLLGRPPDLPPHALPLPAERIVLVPGRLALAILIAAVVPNVPGFLAAAGFVAPEAVPPLFHTLYTYAWFVGFGIALVAYSLWAGRTRDTITAAELHAA